MAIRALTRADLPQLPTIHERAFGKRHFTSQEVRSFYEVLYPRLFLEHPWFDAELAPIVYERDDVVSGMMALLQRPMLFGQKPIRMAVTTQFAIDPTARSGMAAVQMIKRVFRGEQDLLVTDISNEISRKTWEACGGRTATAFALQWIRPFRPLSALVSTRSRKSRLDGLAAKAAHTIDRALAARKIGWPDVQAPKVRSETLTPQLYFEHITALTEHLSLRPLYDDLRAVEWLWYRLERCQPEGTTRAILLRSEKDEVVGSYVYRLVPGRMSDVLQVAARPGKEADVLAALLADAASAGAAALRGRSEPRLQTALVAAGCLFHGHHANFLVHAKDPAILEAFERGDVFLSHLEGEYLTRLDAHPHDPPPAFQPAS